MAKSNNHLAVGFYTPLMQVPVTVIVKKKAPTAQNKNYSVGQVWIANTNTNQYTIYMFCGVNLTAMNNPQGIWVSIGTNIPASSTAQTTAIVEEKK